MDWKGTEKSVLDNQEPPQMSERDDKRFAEVTNANSRSVEDQIRLMDQFELQETERLDQYWSGDNEDGKSLEESYNESMAKRELEKNIAIEERIMSDPKTRFMYMMAQHIAELRANGGHDQVIKDKEDKLQERLENYIEEIDRARDIAMQYAAENPELRVNNQVGVEEEYEMHMEDIRFIIDATRERETTGDAKTDAEKKDREGRLERFRKMTDDELREIFIAAHDEEKFKETSVEAIRAYSDEDALALMEFADSSKVYKTGGSGDTTGEDDKAKKSKTPDELLDEIKDSYKVDGDAWYNGKKAKIYSIDEDDSTVQVYIPSDNVDVAPSSPISLSFKDFLEHQEKGAYDDEGESGTDDAENDEKSLSDEDRIKLDYFNESSDLRLKDMRDKKWGKRQGKKIDIDTELKALSDEGKIQFIDDIRELKWHIDGLDDIKKPNALKRLHKFVSKRDRGESKSDNKNKKRIALGFGLVAMGLVSSVVLAGSSRSADVPQATELVKNPKPTAESLFGTRHPIGRFIVDRNRDLVSATGAHDPQGSYNLDIVRTGVGPMGAAGAAKKAAEQAESREG